MLIPILCPVLSNQQAYPSWTHSSWAVNPGLRMDDIVDQYEFEFLMLNWCLLPIDSMANPARGVSAVEAGIVDWLSINKMGVHLFG